MRRGFILIPAHPCIIEVSLHLFDEMCSLGRSFAQLLLERPLQFLNDLVGPVRSVYVLARMLIEAACLEEKR